MTECADPLALDPNEEVCFAPPSKVDLVQGGLGPRGRTPGLTADGKLRTGKLAGLSMGGAMWVLAWPVLVESVLNSFVGLTDTFLSAQISEPATDAIGGAAYILWLMGLFVMAIAIGATALVSRAIGKGRTAVANAATGQTIFLGAIVGAVVGVLVAMATPVLAFMLRLEGVPREEFLSYLRIISIGVPAIGVMVGGTACCRGAGDSVRPLTAMALVNVVNIVSSWFLSGVDLTATTVTDSGQRLTRVLLANPLDIEPNVQGIAWGTVLGEYVGAFIVLFILIRGYSGVRLRARRLKPHWHTMRRLVRVGIPSLLEMLGMWAGNFLVIMMVGFMARTGLMGSHILAVRIESFSYLPGFALGTAVATLAGQYLGAGRPDMAKRAVNRCALITSAIMGSMGVLFVCAPRFVVSLISSQPTHLEVTPDVIFVAGWVQIPFGLGLVWRSALRGAGDARPVMWIVWVCTYLVRLPLAYVCSGVDLPSPFGEGVIENPFVSEPTLVGLWVGLCIELTIRGTLFGIWYFRGRWAHVKV